MHLFRVLLRTAVDYCYQKELSPVAVYKVRFYYPKASTHQKDVCSIASIQSSNLTGSQFGYHLAVAYYMKIFRIMIQDHSEACSVRMVKSEEICASLDYLPK